MRLRLAFGLLCGLALSGQATSPAQAQTECPYLTRPRAESENGATRINQWAEGTVLCFHSRVLRCAAAAWHDQGECPDSAKWHALDATSQEQNAHPVGVTTPAPAMPPDAPPSPPTQTASPGIGARAKDVDATLVAPVEATPAAKAIGMPAEPQQPPRRGDIAARTSRRSVARAVGERDRGAAGRLLGYAAPVVRAHVQQEHRRIPALPILLRDRGLQA
jgi:hypothetical protein